MPPPTELWNTHIPWLYKSIIVSQLDGQTPCLDWGGEGGMSEGCILTASNNWPRSTNGSLITIKTSIPKKNDRVQEFPNSEVGIIKNKNHIQIESTIINAVCARTPASPGVAIIKTTEGVTVADIQNSCLMKNITLQRYSHPTTSQLTNSLSAQINGSLIIYTTPDSQVNSWDISGNSSHVFMKKPPTGFFTDVCFAGGEPSWVFSTTSEGNLDLVDIRSPQKASSEFSAPVGKSLTTVRSSCVDSSLVVTGGDLMYIWDTRITGRGHLLSFDHGSEVTNISLHPTDPSLIVSSDLSGCCYLWDLSLTTTHVNQQGDLPTELIFKHAGHQSKLTALSWGDNNLIASSDESGSLHIYSPLVLHNKDG